MKAPLANLLAVAALAAAALPASDAAEVRFKRNETRITPRVDLFDPEFNQLRAQMTWVDSKGNLWIAGVDRATGTLVPSGGKGVLAATGALASADLLKVGNGPEWLYGLGDDRIVYTRFLPRRPHELENARIALAEMQPDGRWVSRSLSNQARYRPYASADPGDPAPRISYIDPDNNQYWQEVDTPGSETVVPGIWNPKLLAMRFIEGLRAAISVAPIDGVPQIVRIWLDTGLVEQLTFDGDHETTSSPFMWAAPEFGGEYVFAVAAADSASVSVYRRLGAGPAWTPVHTVQAPAGVRLLSVEPFTHNGKSYLTMSGVVQPNTFASRIYLANIDPALPVLRQLTPEEPLRTRTDPEVFVTDAGPRVYFNRADKLSGPPCPCPEGLYATDTGLGPPLR